MDELKRLNKEHAFSAMELLRNAFSSSEQILYLLAISFAQWINEIKNKNNYEEFDLSETLTIYSRDRANYVKITSPKLLDITVEDLINSPDLGERLNSLFNQLENYNQRELGGVFNGLDFASKKFSNEYERFGILKKLLVSFQIRPPVTYEIADYYHNLFDDYLELACDSISIGSAAPEFNTPKSVSSLIAAIVSDQEYTSIYDPACGSGQLLLACASSISKTDKKLELAGAEINHSAWSIARLNLIAHGYSSSNVLNINSLSTDEKILDKSLSNNFDLVVAHPPWGLRNWRNEQDREESYSRFKYGVPPRNNADYAFLLHMISLMNPSGGRLCAVVSNGVLTRTGVEGDIRRRLLEDNLVDAVIALPEKFFALTSIAGAILILSTNRDRKDVLFIDASKVTSYGRSRNSLSESAIKEITSACHERETIADFSSVVGLQEIADNEFSLSVTQYVRKKVQSERRPLDEIYAERLATEIALHEISERINREISALMDN